MYIKNFFLRIQSGSLSRMMMYAGQIKEETGISRLFIVLDMLWCILRYGVGYLEYRVFGWAYIRGIRRKTFMTMKHNIRFTQRLNDAAYSPLFDDKLKFNARFQAYLGRGWLDLNKTDFARFEEFCNGKDAVFAKETDGFGGVGARKIDLTACGNLKALYDSLRENRQYLVEDLVIQCEKMNELCPSSINTVRIVTVLLQGKAHVMYSLVRMGNGTKPVDNISSGGMYAPVDENGIIYKPAFCDKTGELYEVHPFTKTKITGFQIPFYEQAVEMVKKAAFEVPQVGYVGWDVGMSTDGPVLIEGNTLPGYDMCQNYYHLREDKQGILSKFNFLFTHN